MSTCTICGNTGRVLVPHPKFVKDNFWSAVRKMRSGRPHYATATVTCTCGKGRKIFDQLTEVAEKKKLYGIKPMSLEQYRAKVCATPEELMTEIFPNYVIPEVGRNPREIAKEVAEGTVPY